MDTVPDSLDTVKEHLPWIVSDFFKHILLIFKIKITMLMGWSWLGSIWIGPNKS